MTENLSVSGKLPKGDGNGLYVLVPQLIREVEGEAPRRMHAVIALIDAKKLTVDADDGSRQPQVRIRRIEVLTEDDLGVGEKLIRRALDKRSAQGADGALPFELEQDLEEAFSFGDEEADPDLDEAADDEADGDEN